MIGLRSRCLSPYATIEWSWRKLLHVESHRRISWIGIWHCTTSLLSVSLNGGRDKPSLGAYPTTQADHKGTKDSNAVIQPSHLKACVEEVNQVLIGHRPSGPGYSRVKSWHGCLRTTGRTDKEWEMEGLAAKRGKKPTKRASEVQGPGKKKKKKKREPVWSEVVWRVHKYSSSSPHAGDTGESSDLILFPHYPLHLLSLSSCWPPWRPVLLWIP